MNQIFVSSSCIKKPNTLREQLVFFQKNKIFNIELSGNLSSLPLFKIKYELKKYKKKGFKFLLHNYFPAPKKPIVLNFISKNLQTFKASKSIIKNAINISHSSMLDFYAFHPGYLSDADLNKDGYFIFKKKNFTRAEGLNIFIERFSKFYDLLNLEKKSCKIALENLFPEPNGHINSIMCTYEEIEEVLLSQKLKKKKIFLIIDLGHLAISSNFLNFDRIKFIEKILEKFEDRILEVHISENDEKNDLHLGLKINSWQLEALRIFKKKKKNLIYTLESRNCSIREIKNNIKMIKSAIY